MAMGKVSFTNNKMALTKWIKCRRVGH